MANNRIFLLGELMSEPVLQTVKEDMSLCKLKLRTTTNRIDESGVEHEHVDWHIVVVFGRLAENCVRYLSKGREIYVEGRVSTSNWLDASGKRHWKTEIVAQSVEFLRNIESESVAA